MGTTFKPENYKWNGQRLKFGDEGVIVEATWEGIPWSDIEAMVLKESLGTQRTDTVKTTKGYWHVQLREDGDYTGKYGFTIEVNTRLGYNKLYSFYPIFVIE